MDLLIKKAKKQDKSAFQQLMKMQTESMYKIAKAILGNDEDVADAMQETALTCWLKINTLRNEKHFKTWLTRIMINHCNSIYRKRKETISDVFIPDKEVFEAGYMDVEWRELFTCLDENHRIVLILYYVQGFKTREIAMLLKLNESTVRSRLSVARKKLEEQYLGKE